jgi:outer membrane protein OmpA-like peptidoglycan-associated protein
VEFINDSYLPSHTDFDFTGQESYKEVSLDIGMKSDYTLQLMVKDKDLGFTLNSFLSVTDNTGQVLYKDSVHAIDFPFALKLNTTKQYVLSISAPAYTATNQPVAFKASALGPEMPLMVSLEHDKVRFVTDVTDVSTRQKTRTKIHYSNEDTDEVIVAEAGETVYLRKGDRYQVVTSSDRGYLFSSAAIVAGETASSDLNLTITPLKEGAGLTLNHITFPSNSADLKQSSFIELDQVTDLLINNPDISIEISAHTDDVGDDDYNMTLSGKRAQAVLEYLTKKKIDSGRLVAKGYGETRPLASNDSESNRELNRRVELVILKVN